MPLHVFEDADWGVSLWAVFIRSTSEFEYDFALSVASITDYPQDFHRKLF
jgi:hypothetical protein